MVHRELQVQEQSHTIAKTDPSLKRLRTLLRIAYQQRLVVSALIAANCIWFSAMVCIAGVKSALIPSSQTLLNWGASAGYVTITDEQWWRLISSSFVHVGIFHLGINMFVLNNVGKDVELWFGSQRLCAVWFAAATGGALTSLFVNPTLISAGASGAIFGLFGSMLAFVWRRKRSSPVGSLKVHGLTILMLVVYSIIYGAFDKSLDNAAHFGGLIFGFIAGITFLPRENGDKTWRTIDGVKALIFCVGYGAIYLSSYALFAKRSDVIAEASYTKAVVLLHQEQFAQALPLLNQTVTLSPENDSALSDRARALAGLKRFDEALVDCAKSVKIAKDKKVAFFERASIYHQMRKYDAAESDLNQVLAIDPKSAMAYNNRAWNFAAKGDYLKCLEDCKQALQMDPQLTTAYDTRAVAEISLDRLPDALSDLDNAISRKVVDGAYFFHRAIARRRLHRLGFEEDQALATKYKYEPEDWEPR